MTSQVQNNLNSTKRNCNMYQYQPKMSKCLSMLTFDFDKSISNSNSNAAYVRQRRNQSRSPPDQARYFKQQKQVKVKPEMKDEDVKSKTAQCDYSMKQKQIQNNLATSQKCNYYNKQVIIMKDQASHQNGIVNGGRVVIKNYQPGYNNYTNVNQPQPQPHGRRVYAVNCKPAMNRKVNFEKDKLVKTENVRNGEILKGDCDDKVNKTCDDEEKPTGGEISFEDFVAEGKKNKIVNIEDECLWGWFIDMDDYHDSTCAAC